MTASDTNSAELSSAAILLDDRAPQVRQRWISAQSPPRRTQTATGSITAPQSASRSPGSTSRCRLQRHHGQWLRFSVPPPCKATSSLQLAQRNVPRSSARKPGLVRCFFKCSRAPDRRVGGRHETHEMRECGRDPREETALRPTAGGSRSWRHRLCLLP